MTIKYFNKTFFDKNERDKIEHELVSKDFIQVPTLSKLLPRQYQMSQHMGDEATTEGPMMYEISWCIDD